MFDIEKFRSYCLSKKGVTEEFPFDADTLVFKVMGKMFALTSLDQTELSINLKCDPEKAEMLRAQYPAVTPGYHMSKKHWNTVAVDGTIPLKTLLAMIDESYDLVVAGLPLKVRRTLSASAYLCWQKTYCISTTT